MSRLTLTPKINQDEDDDLIDFTDIERELREEGNEAFDLDKAAGDNWLDEADTDEGQLSIDVHEKADAFVIVSTIAGVKPEDLDISIENDMVTIHGQRTMEEKVSDDDYLFKECYWGSFSRSIILPLPIKSEGIKAHIKNGVLTITLPKAKPNNKIKVTLKE